MSIVDKALSAVTPPEKEEDRIEATRTARAAAGQGTWLSLALDHHDQIRQAFDACRSTEEREGRISAMKQLALVLNGHSLAEEVVLYPALAKTGHKASAGMAYTEQTTTKMQMAELERIEPLSNEWLDKLEHIRGAVLHHMFEEESSWFLKLKDEYDDQRHLTARFREEFERYAGGDEQSEAGGQRVQDEPRSFLSDRPADPGVAEGFPS